MTSPATTRAVPISVLAMPDHKWVLLAIQRIGHIRVPVGMSPADARAGALWLRRRR